MSNVRDPQISKERTVSDEIPAVSGGFFQALQFQRQKLEWEQYLKLLMG